MKTIYLELLEKYFNNEMSPQDMAGFEQSLKENPELEKAFNEYQEILESLKDNDTLDLRTKLREIREEQMKQGNKWRFMDGNTNWFWLAALFTIVVSFTIIISLMIKNTRTTDQAMVSALPSEVFKYAKLNDELMKYGIRKHGMNLELPADSSDMITKSEILFKWTVDSTYNLLLDVIDKEGNVVFVSHRPIESPYFFNRDLREGIYVFRFRNDKETFNLTFLYVN